MLSDRDICPAKEFQGIIRYERARADRAGGRFALVSLAHTLVSERGVPQELTRALRRRIRATDVLGWLDDRTLSVLLPGADRQGATRFVANFQKHHAGELGPSLFTVYCYPDYWLHGGNGNGAGGTAAADAGNGNRNGSGDGRVSQGANAAAFSRIERKVEAAVVRRLPVWKRALDIVAALIGLVATLPIFLIVAAYIKIVSPGPVLFKQKRLGYRAVPFTFLKFRTMRADNDPRCHQVHLKELINSDKPMEKLDNGRDPRIIRGGRVLRKICVDELPQMINVLRGEMSVVGPRPCLPYEAEEYLRWHSHRFDVLPGITGLWQVSGKNRLTFKQMIRLDIVYCRDMSLWLDVSILLRTVPTVIGLFFEGVGNRLRRSVNERAAHRTNGSQETSGLSE